MRYIIVIFMFIFLLFAGKEVYFSDDANKNIAYGIVAENAYVFGCDNVLKNTPTNVSYSLEETDFLKLKKRIVAGDLFVGLEKEVNTLSKLQQFLLNGLISAEKIKQKDVNGFNKFIINAYLLMAKLSVFECENACYEIIRALADCDDKLAQEHATILLLKQRDIDNKYIHLYLLLYKKYSRQKLLSLLNDTNFKANNELLHRLILMHKYDIKKRDNNNFEKYFHYNFKLFLMPWTVKRWNDFNFPLFAYFCHLSGRDGYDSYREKSISPMQFENVKGGLYEYVEYGVKVFALSGDIKTAIKLLDMLPNGHKKNFVLKRVSPYLSLRADFIFEVANSNVF